MTPDIQELKLWANAHMQPGTKDGSLIVPRDTILALIEENERLREALAPFAKAGQWYTPKEAEYEIGGMIKVADLFAARAALKEATDV